MGRSCARICAGSSTGRCGTASSPSVLGLLLFAASLAGARHLADRLSAAAGHRPFAARHRAAAGLAARRHAKRSPMRSSTGCAAARKSRASSSTADASRRHGRTCAKPRLTINYVPKGEAVALAAAARAGDQPGARRTCRIFASGSSTRTGKRNVTFIVTGEDADTVANVAAELAAADAAAAAGRPTSSSSATLNRPELRIYPRRDLAVRLGVSTESLSETIRVATIGDVGPALATLRCRRSHRAHSRAAGGEVRAPTGRCSSSCACRPARRQRAARSRWPISASAKARSASIATTGSGRPRSRRIWSEARRSAMRSTAVRDLPMMKNLPPGVSGRGGRRRRAAGRAVRGLRRGDAQRPDDGLCRARGAVRAACCSR